MSYEIVSYPRHKSTKVGAGIALDEIGRFNHCPIGLSEIDAALCDHPIVFLKAHDTGQFRLVALTGFQPGRNLFVLDEQYLATYLPLQFARAPFALAQTDAGTLAITIDLDHPRTNDPLGKDLYDDSGRESAFLVERRDQLKALVDDQAATVSFVAALVEQGLLAAMPIDLDPVGGTNPERLDGLYTISKAKLTSMSDASILAFFRKDYLSAIAAIMCSLAQFSRLQQLHNAHSARESNMTALENVSVGLPD